MDPLLPALRTAYADLGAVVGSLDEPASWRPSGCAGWAVRDLVFHLLGDAQRALVALAGDRPTGPVDRDAVSYWQDAPGRADPDSRNLRATRTMASAWRLDALVGQYGETSRAVLALAARVPAGTLVATQGHVLTVDDLLATLVTEAALHHLDLVDQLARPGPRGEPLAVVRRTLDALLGRPTPVDADDRTWALLATGRQPLTPTQRQALGSDADRLPLIR